MNMTKIGGHDVAWIEMGDGPLAVFAHCSLAQAGLWTPVMKRLSDRWRCVALDMPGHGRTSRGDPDLSLQLQAAEYIEGLTETLGGGPAHMVGLSLGGAVMGRVGARRPDLVRSLTLIEPIYFFLIRDKRPDMAAENIRAMTPVVEACREGRYRDGARAFMEAWGQPGQFDRFPEAAKDAVARSLSFVSEDFVMVDDAAPRGQITPAEIAGLRPPVLLLEGARTQASARAIQDELAALISGAERDVIPAAGHLSPVDAPEAVAARLARFFETVEQAAAAA